MSEAVEKILFERGVVRISTTRAVMGSSTYAIATLNRVSFHQLSKWTVLPVVALFLGVPALGLAGISALMALSSNDRGASLGCVVFFGAVGAAAIGLALVKLLAAPRYAVALTTSSGDISAMETPDIELARSVVAALNEALVSRG